MKSQTIGCKERSVIRHASTLLRQFNVMYKDKGVRETALNGRILSYLQSTMTTIVSNVNIPSPELFGETFRPEFYIGSKRLCGVECKRLTEHSAKTRWKEGISQALLYSTIYKHVFLVLMDFTKKRIYYNAFADLNSAESIFATKLLKSCSIEIISLNTHTN